MKILKKLKYLYKNLGKEKCPNCNTIGFKDKILKKTFIEKKIISKLYQRSDREHLMRGYSTPYERRYTTEFYDEEISIYDINYLCDNCNYVIQKRIGETEETKVLMSLPEYKKL